MGLGMNIYVFQSLDIDLLSINHRLWCDSRYLCEVRRPCPTREFNSGIT